MHRSYTYFPESTVWEKSCEAYILEWPLYETRELAMVTVIEDGLILLSTYALTSQK